MIALEHTFQISTNVLIITKWAMIPFNAIAMNTYILLLKLITMWFPWFRLKKKITKRNNKIGSYGKQVAILVWKKIATMNPYGCRIWYYSYLQCHLVFDGCYNKNFIKQMTIIFEIVLTLEYWITTNWVQHLLAQITYNL